jgi:hypothetical protein
LSQQVDGAVQAGDSPTGSADRVHPLNGLAQDTDRLVELATLSQDGAQASRVESVVTRKRRRIHSGKSGAGSYLGRITLPGDRGDPRFVPGQIGRTPEIQPGRLIPASSAVEPLVSLADRGGRGPAIACLGVSNGFPRRQQGQQYGAPALIVSRCFSGGLDHTNRLRPVTRIGGLLRHRRQSGHADVGYLSHVSKMAGFQPPVARLVRPTRVVGKPPRVLRRAPRKRRLTVG